MPDAPVPKSAWPRLRAILWGLSFFAVVVAIVLSKAEGDRAESRMTRAERHERDVRRGADEAERAARAASTAWPRATVLAWKTRACHVSRVEDGFATRKSCSMCKLDAELERALSLDGARLSIDKALRDEGLGGVDAIRRGVEVCEDAVRLPGLGP